MADGNTWRECSICRTKLAFGAPYFICSVSTCQRKRNPLYFCSLACWEAHLPMMRHRDAWAEEAIAPSREEWEAERRASPAEEDDRERDGDDFADTTGVRPVPVSRADEPVRRRRIVTEEESSEDSRDILVVVSKLKKYIKARANMNTSDGVAVVLSDVLRRLCNEAIRNAARDGRRTVMDRDFEGLE